MLNFHQLILNVLIRKFEARKDYGKGVKHVRRTILPVNRRTFPDYFHDTDSRFRQEFNRAAKELEGEGFVQVEWVRFSKGEEIEKLYLNDAKTQAVYSILGVNSKEAKHNQMRKWVSEFAEPAPLCLQNFYNEILGRIQKYQSLSMGLLDFDSEQDTKDGLKGLNALVQNKEEILRRIWSMRLYQNSKRWEQIEKKILQVVRKYVISEGENEWTDHDILEYYGIFENPQRIYIYGPLILDHQGKRLDFSIDITGLGVSSRLIQGSTIADLAAKKVITIENLTTFYDFVAYVEQHHLPFLVVYLGGFANEGKKKLLRIIYEYSITQSKSIAFCHWGDLDLGGFRIWHHLMKTTSIPFDPWWMDASIYIRHLHLGKSIHQDLYGASYLDSLHALLKQPSYQLFHEVISLILKHQIVIEQEAISLSLQSGKKTF